MLCILVTFLLSPSETWAADSLDTASVDTSLSSLGAKDETGEAENEERSDVSQEDGRVLAPNEVEAALAQMIVNHPKQERAELVYDPHLHLVARAKALDMAKRRYKGHVDPDGIGPNYVVRSLGYELPAHYSDGKSANNIESVAWFGKATRGGQDDLAEEPNETASRFVEMWYESPNHKRHLVGQGFNADQTRFGVGYVQVDGDTRRRSRARRTKSEYAVFITAPPSLTEPSPLTAEVVEDYLSRTPRERERGLRSGRNP